MAEKSIGIDLGGTTITAGIVNIQGEIRHKSIVPSNAKQGRQAILEAMQTCLADLRKHDPSINSVGVGSPGLIDPENGVVLGNAENLCEWNGTPIKQELEAASGCSVFVDNDANLAALGESVFGAGKEERVVICLTLGTGIGGGIVIDNTVYHGKSNLGSEIGHLIVETGGRPCTCGQNGCLEAYCSATGIVKRTLEKIATGEPSVITETFTNRLEELTSKDICEAARNGDTLCRTIMNDTGKYLSAGVGSIINIFNPSILVFSGNLTKAGDTLFVPFREHLPENSLAFPREDAAIAVSELAEDAGMLGAAYLAMEKST